MRKPGFRVWLENVYITEDDGRLKPGPINDALSRCKRIEEYQEVDLDRQFAMDGLNSLIEKFNPNLPTHNVKFGKNCNVHKGTSSLKSAIVLYKQFCEWDG